MQVSTVFLSAVDAIPFVSPSTTSCGPCYLKLWLKLSSHYKGFASFSRLWCNLAYAGEIHAPDYKLYCLLVSEHSSWLQLMLLQFYGCLLAVASKIHSSVQLKKIVVCGDSCSFFGGGGIPGQLCSRLPSVVNFSLAAVQDLIFEDLQVLGGLLCNYSFICLVQWIA